jgi:cytochrome P450
MQKGSAHQPAEKLNLLALRRHYTNPHHLYDALRARGDLYFDASSQSWLATGHRVITGILDDARFLSNMGSASGSASAGQLAPVSRQMLFMDGEKHRTAQSTMLRPLAQMVKSLPPVIRKIARQALAEVEERGEIELVSQFASPISLLTIAHVLGIPVEDRDLLHQLEQWSDTFGDITSGYFRGNMQDVQKLEDYFRQLIAQKRRNPSDDLLSSFISAHEIFPEEDDLVANCMMVFAAGRITTKKLLGNGCNFLLPAWQQYQTDLQADPRFVKSLGEELLRVVTPTRYLIREAGEDIHFATSTGTQLIQRGQRVLLFLEAADYDPALFEKPTHFHPQRRPNKHIAFGYGPHQCPGATLARVEIQLALEELFALPSLCPKPGTSPVWNPNPNLGGFTSNSLVFPSRSQQEERLS